MCSTSTSEHLETLSSAASVAEDSGGWGASAVGTRGGRASPAVADREAVAVVADPLGFPTADAGGGSGAAMVVLPSFSLFLQRQAVVAETLSVERQSRSQAQRRRKAVSSETFFSFSEKRRKLR